jgi:hypothetical protein
MPIKPENRARYPKDWPAISLLARERARWCCQHVGCTAHQYAVGWWRESRLGHVWVPEWPRDGAYMGQTYADAREVAAGIYAAQGESGAKPTVIVLTVAHLNHTPEDCRPNNLAAMCQRHHLAYDHDHHRANAQATRRAKAGTLEMF